MSFGEQATLHAQAPEAESGFVVDTWQTDAGLPDNSVTAILQTQDGYLWLGTSNGLARFDGVRFTTFRVLDNPALKSNRINCLHESPPGLLWIGTDGGGVPNYHDGQFTSLTTAEGLSSDTVQCLGTDPSGQLWVGTAFGLNRRVGGRWTTYFKTDGLPDDCVYALCQRFGSAMLFATGKGLCRFSGERLRAFEAPIRFSGHSNFFCLHEDRAGRLWLGGEAGLFRLPAAGDGGPAQPSMLSSAWVPALVERANGEIWFGTSEGVLCRAAPASEAAGVQLAWRFHSPVTALAEDREGNLWIGTAGDGLHRLKRRQLRWIPSPEALAAAWPPSFFESPGGDLRLLTSDKRLYRCQNGRFALLGRLPLPDGVVVQTVCGTGADEFWIGTLGDGLFRCHQGALRQFTIRDGLSDSEIEALCADEDGGLWIGTRNGGLNHLQGGTVIRFNTPWGFSGNYACTLAKDPQRNLWIGTTGDGLFQLRQGRFISYTETNGLPSDDIRALYADGQGRLWVGTAKGLCRLTDGRITLLSGTKRLPNEAILQFHCDAEGNLWVGSSSGVFRISNDQILDQAGGRSGVPDAIPYGKEDGLPGFQCAPAPQSQGPPDRAGAVWFSATKGLVLAGRDALAWNALPPPVILEQALVENESVPLNGLLRVPPGKDSLQFQYTALSLTAPGKICFRYQLEGFDRAWSEAGPSRATRYPKVPPGRYRFRVVACNNDGVWNEAGASVAILITPFWWATLWFRLSLLAAVAALLGGLYRLRLARRRELDRLRVRIATNLHDDIGSSIWSITLLSRMLAKHGTLGAGERQDVDEIHRISVQTSNAIRDIIWLINPSFDSLQDLLLRVKDFAGTMLRGMDFRLQYETADLSKTLPLDFRQNLFLFFKEALTNIAKHAHATVVEIQLQELPGLWRFSIRDNGVGFDPAAATQGNGLKNLRLRAGIMRAQLEIQSQPGAGATLVLTAPWP